eukprot:7382677-Prymnesium_polylepis.3
MARRRRAQSVASGARIAVEVAALGPRPLASAAFRHTLVTSRLAFASARRAKRSVPLTAPFA